MPSWSDVVLITVWRERLMKKCWSEKCPILSQSHTEEEMKMMKTMPVLQSLCWRNYNDMSLLREIENEEKITWEEMSDGREEKPKSLYVRKQLTTISNETEKMQSVVRRRYQYAVMMMKWSGKSRHVKSVVQCRRVRAERCSAAKILKIMAALVAENILRNARSVWRPVAAACLKKTSSAMRKSSEEENSRKPRRRRKYYPQKISRKKWQHTPAPLSAKTLPKIPAKVEI